VLNSKGIESPTLSRRHQGVEPNAVGVVDTPEGCKLSDTVVLAPSSSFAKYSAVRA
jgi:hypothetical protein